MCLHVFNVQPKTNGYFLFRSIYANKRLPKLHCNAKCTYKHKAQEVKMNDTNLTNSNTWILHVL